MTLDVVNTSLIITGIMTAAGIVFFFKAIYR